MAQLLAGVLQLAAVALGGAALRQAVRRLWRQAVLFGQALAQGEAFFGFGIKRLRNTGRAALGR